MEVHSIVERFGADIVVTKNIAYVCGRYGVGKKLGEMVVSATTSGRQQALWWARERFGAEDGVGHRGLSAFVGARGAGLCLRPANRWSGFPRS